MQVCPQCYREAEDGHRFCGACGCQLNNNCPDCGFTNLPGQEFCGECGQQILDVTTPTPEGAEVTPSKPTVDKADPDEGFSMDIALPSLDSIEMSPGEGDRPEPQEESLSGDLAEDPVLPSSEDLNLGAGFSSDEDIVDIMPPSLDEISGTSHREDLGSSYDELPPVSELPSSSPAKVSGTLGVLLEILQTPAFEQAVLDAGISDEALLDAFNQTQDQIAAQLSQQGMEVHLADHDIIRGQLTVDSTSENKSNIISIVEMLKDLCLKPIDVAGISTNVRAGAAFLDALDDDSRDENSEDVVIGLNECSVADPNTLLIDDTVASIVSPELESELVQKTTDDGQSVTAFRLIPSGLEQQETVIDETPEVLDVPVEESVIPSDYTTHHAPEEEPTSETVIELDEEVPEEEYEQSLPVEETTVSQPQDVNSFQFESIHFEPERYVMLGDKTPPNTNYEKAVASLFDEFTAITQPEAKGKVVQLIAEDGVGKSYILNIARSLIDPQINQSIIWLGAHHYQSFSSKQLPFMMWYQLFYNTMGLIPEGHAVDDVQAQVTAFLNYLCEGQISEPMQDILHDLLSVSPVEGIPGNMSEFEGRFEQFMVELLTLMSANKPVVIVLDNVHLADHPSLGLLSRIIQRGMLARRILFVLTHTEDCVPSGKLANVFSKVPVNEISVANLTRVEMDKFLNDGPFGGQIEQFPIAFLEKLYQSSKGKPLYLEEALRWLHLNDYLETDEKTNKFIVEDAEGLLEAVLPEKIESIISQRVEVLEDESRYLLQLASVLGECFSISMLMSLSQQDQETFNHCLEHLLNHGLIQPDATNTGRFRHGRIWKVVYQNIAPSLRQQFHQLVSEALEEDVKNHMTVSPFVRAYHAVSGNLVNRAIHYLAMSGAQMAVLGCREAANLSLFNAVDFFQHLPVEKLEISHTKLYARLLEDIALLNLREQPELSITVLNKIISIYKDSQPALLVETLGLLSSAYENQGNYHEALAVIDDMVELLDAEQYPLEVVSVNVTKLEQLYHLGRFQEGVDLYLKDIDPVASVKLHELNEPQRYLYYSARLLTAKMLTEQLDERGLTWIEKTLADEKQMLQNELQIAYRLARGKALILKGNYKQCDTEAEALLSDIENLEDSDWHYAQWGLLALEYHSAKGDWQNATDILLTVLNKANDARDYLTAMTAETWAGYLKYQFNGDAVTAMKQLNEAIHKSSEYRFASTALLGWQFMSEIHLELSHLDEAESLIDNAMAVAKKDIYNQKHRLYELTLLKARVLVARQDKEKTPAAGKILEGLWPEVVQTKSPPVIAHTAEAIGELYKTLAHQASEKSRKKHLMRAIQFYQKANGIWLDLENQYYLKRVQERTPRM